MTLFLQDEYGLITFPAFAGAILLLASEVYSVKCRGNFYSNELSLLTLNLLRLGIIILNKSLEIG